MSKNLVGRGEIKKNCALGDIKILITSGLFSASDIGLVLEHKNCTFGDPKTRLQTANLEFFLAYPKIWLEGKSSMKLRISRSQNITTENNLEGESFIETAHFEIPK